MSDLAEAKPGDTLFIWTHFNRKGRLATVERKTPSGLVVLKNGDKFNVDGYMRGASGWDRPRARIATPDDISGVNRWNLVTKIERFRAWDKLSADDLKAVSEIVGRNMKD